MSSLRLSILVSASAMPAPYRAPLTIFSAILGSPSPRPSVIPPPTRQCETLPRNCAGLFCRRTRDPGGASPVTDLPGELVTSRYLSVRDGKIVSLVVIFSQPHGY